MRARRPIGTLPAILCKALGRDWLLQPSMNAYQGGDDDQYPLAAFHGDFPPHGGPPLPERTFPAPSPLRASDRHAEVNVRRSVFCSGPQRRGEFASKRVLLRSSRPQRAAVARSAQRTETPPSPVDAPERTTKKGGSPRAPAAFPPGTAIGILGERPGGYAADVQDAAPEGREGHLHRKGKRIRLVRPVLLGAPLRPWRRTLRGQ